MTPELTPLQPPQSTVDAELADIVLTEMDKKILAMNTPKPSSCHSDEFCTVHHTDGRVTVEKMVPIFPFEKALLEERKRAQRTWFKVRDW
jgi:hypothetical protein